MYASGDSEDDDKLPCVIGESEGDCIWRGSWRSVESLFHRQGALYKYFTRTYIHTYHKEKVKLTVGKHWQSVLPSRAHRQYIPDK